jgi:hypothetical protein
MATLEPGAKVIYKPRNKRTLVTARLVAAFDDHLEVVSSRGFAVIRYEQLRDGRHTCSR